MRLHLLGTLRISFGRDCSNATVLLVLFPDYMEWVGGLVFHWQKKNNSCIFTLLKTLHTIKAAAAQYFVFCSPPCWENYPKSAIHFTHGTVFLANRTSGFLLQKILPAVYTRMFAFLLIITRRVCFTRIILISLTDSFLLQVSTLPSLYSISGLNKGGGSGAVLYRCSR